jgi:hypothetical protein
MSNFLKSLFGAKKAAKVTKSRMQTRRLELIGLEERIVPAVNLTLAAGVLSISSDAAASESLTLSASGQVLTFTSGTENITVGGTVAGSTGTGTKSVTVDLSNVAYAGALLTVIELKGNDTNAKSTVFTINGALDLTVVSATPNIGLRLVDGTQAVDNDANINFAVKTQGTGGVTVTTADAGSLLTIAAAGDITTSTGNVALTSKAITTGGDVTTTAGSISYNGNVTLAASNVATTSTASGGNLSINAGTGAGTLDLSTFNFTANQGAGNVTTIAGGVTSGTGTLSLTGAVVTTVGAINTTGSVIAVATTGDLTFSKAVTGTSVNAKSTAGDVIFANTVTTSAVGGFISEATVATKATKIAALVSVTNGANALVTGNLTATADTNPEIRTSLTGTITITGNVTATTAATNDLNLTAVNGGIIITGTVGSLDALNVNGATTFLASNTVSVNTLNVGQGTQFANSVIFSEAVTVATVLNLDMAASGFVNFAKTITATGTADIFLDSVNGAITVTGAIIGKDDVLIASSGSGLITLSGAISTDGADGLITITNATGNIVTSAGAISTTGATANISIGATTSGNVTLGGNITTAAASLSVGNSANTGALISNGTLTSTGAGAINVLTGTGTAVINKAISSGAGVALTATSAAGTITLAGAVTSTGDVTDTGAGKLSLGANITTTAGDIVLNSLATTLTSDVSLKAAGATKVINLLSVDGAKGLTLEATGLITLTSVGQANALSTVTVTNSNGVTAGAFNAAKVVLTDTIAAANIAFGNIGSVTTAITNSLTTFAKAYNVSFAGTSVISGAPVFLNTGTVTFGGTTSLTTGATITGNAASTVTLGGTIVSGGAFNIGVATNTGVVTINDGTQLILNSTTAASTFAKPIAIGGATGTLSLLGVGTLTLSGDSASGTTGDNISVINGTLNVTGKLGATSVSTATSGTISGAGGEIGILNVNTGTVAPGGTLKTAAVTLNAATNYSAAVLTATTASNLETISAINLGGAVLSLSSVAAGLAVGTTFTIINNTHASNAITGTFANQAEGSSISAKDTAGNTVTFTVSYKGGTGGVNANDVTLKVASITTTTPAPSAPAQPMVPGQPALNKFTAIGSDAGASPTVTITFQNGTFVSFLAYAEGFIGGVRVALGNVDGGTDIELITGAGVGGGPNVKVFKINTTTGAQTLQSNFFAFGGPTFTGGIYVAAGDTNADGFADVIVGAGAGGGPRVSVYAGSVTGVNTSAPINDFFAYASDFTGGVVVAAGQRNAVAGDEVITAPASNGGYHIRSFDLNGGFTVVDNFFAFNNITSVGGLSLAAGLLNAGTIDDLIIGTSNGGYGVLIDSDTSGIAGTPFAGFAGAIRAGVAENSNGQDFAVALAGPTGGPRVSVFSVGSNSLVEVDNLFVANPAGRTGLFGSSTL